MAFVFLWSVLILFVSFISYCHTETDAFNVDVGVSYAFKVQVNAGAEECFAQYVHPESTIVVEFQVVQGGDGKAGFSVRFPNDQPALFFNWQSSADYEDIAHSGGDYQFCIDNTPSRFASKLVGLYVDVYRQHDWEKYIKEMKDAEITVANFTNTLQTVDSRINEMLKYLDYSLRQMSRDWYLIKSNHAYVQLWSAAQCVVIFLTSTLQVYFVRKLFDVKNVTPTSKPRA